MKRGFNPGRLVPIARFTADQPIVPGAGAYDYVKSGGVGNSVPAVGNYPSGAPSGGLAGRLSDGEEDPSAMPGYVVVLGFASIATLVFLAFQPSKRKRARR